MIALLKYGSGMPFNRLEGLQKNLEIPLPSSTQWDVLNKSLSALTPAYDYLVDLFHNDDTPIKILSMIQENKDREKPPDRKGIFTTGIISLFEGKKIALFLSGRNHAGENLNDVLSKRNSDLPPPLQMCDALKRNVPTEFDTIIAYCMVHARRNFIDVIDSFPEECQFVIDILAEVYRFDAETKRLNMTPCIFGKPV